MTKVNHVITRTTAEQKLAKALIKKGVCFEQNFSLEGFEVEFWIEEARLVIEIDGFTHLSSNKSASDLTKDRKLRDKGYTIIRFENRQVHNSLEYCIAEIKSVILKSNVYLNNQGTSINSHWKDALKTIKQQIKSSELKEKSKDNFETYFLNLDHEID